MPRLFLVFNKADRKSGKREKWSLLRCCGIKVIFVVLYDSFWHWEEGVGGVVTFASRRADCPGPLSDCRMVFLSFLSFFWRWVSSGRESRFTITTGSTTPKVAYSISFYSYYSWSCRFWLWYSHFFPLVFLGSADKSVCFLLLSPRFGTQMKSFPGPFALFGLERGCKRRSLMNGGVCWSW